MALPSYMSRREGRCYLQVRLARPFASLVGRTLYRASLRTADCRQARLRLGECMGWLQRMNDSIDFVSLFQKNVIELRTYLADRFPISQGRLLARQHYEELLKNLSRRARAAGFDPDMVEPEYHALFQHFVLQNVDADGWLRNMENLRHYESGRSDMQVLAGHGAIPSSFQAGSRVASVPEINDPRTVPS